MTQVQMTDQQLNRALAELMGYSVNDMNWMGLHQLLKYGSEVSRLPSEDHAWADAPDYCNDPAASLEVQTAAMKRNPAVYCDNLDRIVNPKFCEGKGEYWHETEVYGLIDVRPRERAEAAYITLRSK
ncbi:hypothetical protein [Paenibacillus sp. FSL L8-0499]|uniref:hypothetical protein n=1 Tax=Paenibacillus sp. FSL L8-0499 TaxID=2975334 RepID=UPI0030F6E6A5